MLHLRHARHVSVTRSTWMPTTWRHAMATKAVLLTTKRRRGGGDGKVGKRKLTSKAEEAENRPREGRVGAMDAERVRVVTGDGSVVSWSPEEPVVHGAPVLYWMNRDVRVADNWALIHTVNQAQRAEAPVAVAFAMESPSRLTRRRADFLLGGLRAVGEKLAALRIPLHVLRGDPPAALAALAVAGGFSTVVTDFSPLRAPTHNRTRLAEALSQRGVQLQLVDAHNVVPVWVATDKLEYAARTIRPKINYFLSRYLVDFPQVAKMEAKNLTGAHAPDAAVDWHKFFAADEIDEEVRSVEWATPGEGAGRVALSSFVQRLSRYDKERNDPVRDSCSNLSPWINFGHLSTQRCALEARRAPASSAAYIEELVVRRELSDNFCFHNVDGYDSIDGMYPSWSGAASGGAGAGAGGGHWAQRTLRDHAKDQRAYTYSETELEEGTTHDALWNAAQLQMVVTGKMHGFLRMYWAKKILEWSPSPEAALARCIALNDKYELDGCDPNGYVGCAWAIVGLHDNAWTERPIFGKVRFMNLAGCRRKFDVDKFVAKIAGIVGKPIVGSTKP